MFFSFDGIDGSGKSTQIQLFREWLEHQGHRVQVFRDPGTTQLGERVRDLLLAKTDMATGGVAELLLYMTARAQLVEEQIRPALANGMTVVVDRFLLASLAYQAHAGTNSIDTVLEVGKIATQGVMPAQTFLLDIDPNVAWSRLNRERDRMEERGLAFLSRVRDGFLIEASKMPNEVTVIDASQSVPQIHAAVVQAASHVLVIGQTNTAANVEVPQ